MPALQDQEIVALAQQVIAREGAAVQAAAAQVGPGLVAAARMMAACRGHVLVTGAGTSAAIARRFAHLLSCCGVPALDIDATDCLHGGSGAVMAQDVVYIISKGGRSGEINQLAQIARQRGARVIAQSETTDSPLAAQSDCVVLASAPAEVDLLGGLMALGSSLVNAAVGDALCAVLLELKGYTLAEFGATHPGGDVGRKLAEAAGEDRR